MRSAVQGEICSETQVNLPCLLHWWYTKWKLQSLTLCHQKLQSANPWMHKSPQQRSSKCPYGKIKLSIKNDKKKKIFLLASARRTMDGCLWGCFSLLQFSIPSPSMSWSLSLYWSSLAIPAFSGLKKMTLHTDKWTTASYFYIIPK